MVIMAACKPKISDKERAIQKTREEARPYKISLSEGTKESLEMASAKRAAEAEEEDLERKAILARENLLYIWKLCEEEKLKTYLKSSGQAIPLMADSYNVHVAMDSSVDRLVVECFYEVFPVDSFDNLRDAARAKTIHALYKLTPEIVDQGVKNFFDRELEIIAKNEAYLKKENSARHNLRYLWGLTDFLNIQEYMEDNIRLPLDGKGDHSRIFLRHNKQGEVVVYYNYANGFKYTLVSFDSRGRGNVKDAWIKELLPLSPGVVAGNINKILPEELKIE